MERIHYVINIGNDYTACGTKIWGPDGRIKNSATNSTEATTCKQCKRTHAYRCSGHDKFRDQHAEYKPGAQDLKISPVL